MALALLLCAVMTNGATLQGQQDVDSLLKRICPTPTGKNGYEEFLAAADEVNTPRFTNAFRLAQTAKSGSPDWLTFQRNAISAAPNVRDLVLQGVRKPATDPRTNIGPDTMLPELGQFKTVQRLLVVQANVQFVDGSPREAVQTIEGMLQFANSVENTGVLINYLVGVAMRAIALQSVQSNLDQIPLSSTKSIAKTCDVALATMSLKQAFKAEAKSTAACIDDLAKDRGVLSVWLSNGDENVGKLLDQASRLSGPDYLACLDRARTLIENHNRGMAALSEMPESSWEAETNRLTKILESTPDELVKAIAESMAMSATQPAQAEIKRRTQLRLLKLHMWIRSYRLNANALPPTIDVFNDQNLTRDPLTGRPFVYEKKGDKYELYSLGAMGTGRIDLVYKKGGKVQDDEDPRIKP